ncbi:Uncharacterised protein [uncultured archaeon]|nr:Uncharacterised protein [uncultured archaeon]
MALGYSTGGQQLRTVFQYLQSYGFIDFVLPALFIFALIFGILQKVALFRTPRLGKDGKPVAEEPKTVADRKINGVLAFVIGFAAVLPHMANMYPAKYDPILLINSLLPNTAVLLVAILAVVLLFGIVNVPGAQKSPALQLLIAVVAAGVLIVKFLMDLFPEFFPGSFDFLRDPSIQAVFVVILVFSLVVYFTFKEPSDVKLHTTIRKWVEDKP